MFYSLEDISMGKLLIKTKDGASDAALDDLIEKLKDSESLNVITTPIFNKTTGQPIDEPIVEVNPYRSSASVWDYREEIAPFDLAASILTIFFSFIAIIALTLCFFALVSSMLANIHEQAKEVGILLAIGIPKKQVKLLYIYEAFVVVLAANLLGLMIGVGIGWTITLQRQLFTQIPIVFTFPTVFLLIIFVASAVSAVLSSYQPIHILVEKNSIVDIIRYAI